MQVDGIICDTLIVHIQLLHLGEDWVLGGGGVPGLTPSVSINPCEVHSHCAHCTRFHSHDWTKDLVHTEEDLVSSLYTLQLWWLGLVPSDKHVYIVYTTASWHIVN